MDSQRWDGNAGGGVVLPVTWWQSAAKSASLLPIGIACLSHYTLIAAAVATVAAVAAAAVVPVVVVAAVAWR